ncbi:MAG: hydroxyethylthiazole kinase, partial [Acidaminococcaceae bacterium]
ANIALCFGASPIMADAAEEMGEITSSADCLILNLGTLNGVKLSSMEIAALTARKNQIPVLIDPVGVMASNMRLQAALELITAGVSIVRG